jgi:hypothetical protein
MTRRPLRDTRNIFLNVSAIQALPLVTDLGEPLAANGPYVTFQVDIPATVTGAVKLYGRVSPDASWQELETVTQTGIRVHLASPYVTARVTAYSGTGAISVWAVRDGL